MLTLYRHTRHDRLLALLTAVLITVCLAPLAVTTVVPLIDLPHHVALSRLLWDVIFKQGNAAAHYTADPTPAPYWTVYFLLAVSNRIFGVYAGTKVVVGLCALSVPLGAMRLAIALGRSPRLALGAFLLVWDFNLYFGWLNHVLGVGLALFALAQLFEAETPRAALRAWPVGVALALTHVLPFGFFALAAGLSAIVKRRGLVIHAVGLALPALALGPWLVRSFAGPRVTDPGLVFDRIDVRLKEFFTYTLGSGPLTTNGVNAEGFAFLLLLLGPLFFFLLPQRPQRVSRALALVPLLAALLLYFALPLAVARPVEHWGTYPRFASLILLGVMLLPNPRLTGPQAFWVLPGAVLSAWSSLSVAAQFRAFDAEIAPFYEVLKRVPAGASLLPLCYDNVFPSVRLRLGESLHGYITGNTGGFNPYLFGQTTNLVHYRDEGRPPAPPGWGRDPRSFSMQAYGQHYDYLLVQGAAADPVRRATTPTDRVPTLVFERGRFRLYAVR